MLTASTQIFDNAHMRTGERERTARPGGARKPRSSYHHGDLPRAMLAEAIRVIQRQGIDALTLRGVGHRLGVSRTALYRHFASKDALLQAVASEGFRMLQHELQAAWQGGGQSREGFDAMGRAYVRFAVRHPSHYRVMFGSALRAGEALPKPQSGGDGDAFGTLVRALTAQQQAGLVRSDDPQQLALYVWAVVHGVAMLALDGILRTPEDVGALTELAIAKLWSGIAVETARGSGS